jgi:hypothetical protein
MVAGMRELGFETLLADNWLSPIIVTFFCRRREVRVLALLRSHEGEGFHHLSGQADRGRPRFVSAASAAWMNMLCAALSTPRASR